MIWEKNIVIANFSGIFSWIDKNIENAYEKTLSCMYVCTVCICDNYKYNDIYHLFMWSISNK